MTFEDAFDKAVRAFYEGKKMTEFEKATGTPIKYTKEFFDTMEEEVRPRKPKAQMMKNKKEEDLQDLEEEDAG